MTELEKEKYNAFLIEVSDILGLEKPVNILKLCAITDNFIKSYQERIAGLEKENEELRRIAEHQLSSNMDRFFKNKKLKEGLTELEKENAELKAKAHSVKWHDLRKDPNDLPKEDDVYLIYTIKGYLLGNYEQGGADGKADFCGECYSDFTEYPNEEELMENEVIAWCELPKFEGE